MGEALEGLEIEVLKGVKEGRYTQGKVREEMKGLVARLMKLEVQVGDIAARTSKEKAEIDQRVSRLEREDRKETDAFLRMESSLEEVRSGLQDCRLSRRNNLVFHGLAAIKGEETQATLAEHVRHILHSKLGIGRAVQISRVARLGQSQPVLGCQPVLVTFLQHSHKDEVFRKAALLPRLSGILITEDLPKASLTSPREKLPVCLSSTAGHLNKEGRVKEEKMGEVKHEFEKLLDQQHFERYEDDKNVQQVNLLEEVAEKERDYVEAEDNSENNDDRVEEPAEKYLSGEQDESEREAIVFDPGNEERSEANDSNERNASHVNYSIGGANEFGDTDEPYINDTINIKSDEKEATLESSVINKDFDEAESKEKDRDEKEATGGVNTSENVKDQDNAVFEFFD